MMKYIWLVARTAPLCLMLAATVSAQNWRGRGDSTFVWSARIADGGTLTIKNIVGGITVTEAGKRYRLRRAGVRIWRHDLHGLPR